MPKVNPEILKWARDKANLEPEDACQKIGLHAARGLSAVERLTQLETGDFEPSRALLTRISKAYRRPLVTFFMSNPPRVGDRGQDFRTLPEDRDPSADALLDVLIRDVQARQSLIREALEDADEAIEHEFIGSKTLDSGLHTVLAAIRKQLDFDVEAYAQAQDTNDAFSLLRSAVEAQGIFVLLRGDLGSHHTALDVRDFRGFALADSVAPFVVINDRDSRSAWSFTLIHELTHLWLGQTGVSAAGSDLAIEQFCNDLASEFLLPTSRLLEFDIRADSEFDRLAENITEIATARNVSSSMVAYKLHRLGRINRQTWLRLREHYRELWLQKRQRDRADARDRNSGPNYYVVRRHRVGHALISLTARMLRSGVLTTSKAGLVLGVKAKQVAGLI